MYYTRISVRHFSVHILIVKKMDILVHVSTMKWNLVILVAVPLPDRAC